MYILLIAFRFKLFIRLKIINYHNRKSKLINLDLKNLVYTCFGNLRNAATLEGEKLIYLPMKLQRRVCLNYTNF